jgi:hypothetical protein
MKTTTTERERQRTQVPGYEWIVVSHQPWGVTVTCRAPSESGAYRVAEAEHPGVQWAYVSRRECHCHDRIDCRYAHELCAACERPAQHIDMGTLPVPGIGMAGPRVCGLCYRLSHGLTLADLRARVAQVRGPGATVGGTAGPRATR